MPEPNTSTSSATPQSQTNGTQAQGTQTQQTQGTQTSQNTQVSEPESAYDRIYREYFGDLLGEPAETGTSSSAPNPNEGIERNFQALAQEISSLKQQLTNAGKKPEQVSPEAKKDFLDLYARGDKDGARKLLLSEMLPQMKQDVTKQVSSDVLRAMRAENEIRAFGDQMRTQHPDLIPFERAIGLEAQDLVRQAQEEGLVNTVEDYVRASKKALEVTVASTKKRIQALKGEGAAQAQIRSSEVVSSGAIPPGSSQHQSQDQQAQEPDVSAENFLAYRRARQQASMAGRRAIGRPLQNGQA